MWFLPVQRSNFASERCLEPFEDLVSVHDFTVDDDMVSCVSDLDDFHSCIGEEIAEDVHLELIPESFGGHAEAAPFAILTAYSISQEFQLINPKGDVSHDGNVDVSDIVITVDIIMSTILEIDNYTFWAADMLEDEIIDVIDIVRLVNYILSQP